MFKKKRRYFTISYIILGKKSKMLFISEMPNAVKTQKAVQKFQCCNTCSRVYKKSAVALFFLVSVWHSSCLDYSVLGKFADFVLHSVWWHKAHLPPVFQQFDTVQITRFKQWRAIGQAWSTYPHAVKVTPNFDSIRICRYMPRVWVYWFIWRYITWYR